MLVLSLSKDRLGQSIGCGYAASIGIRIVVKGERNLVTPVLSLSKERRNEPRRNKLLNVIAFDIYRELFTGRAAQPNNG